MDQPCGFALRIPPALRGRPRPAEEELDFLAAWRATKATPQRVFREALTRALRAADLQALRPGSIALTSLATGFPALLEPSPQLDRCPGCELRRHPVGSFPTSARSRVVVERCPCGTGLARWKHDAPEEGQHVVGLYVPGPAAEQVSTLVLCPLPRDPLPTHALALVEGRLVGQLSVLAGELLFTNHLSLTRSASAPLRVSREQLTRVRQVVQRRGRALLARAEAARATMQRALRPPLREGGSHEARAAG